MKSRFLALMLAGAFALPAVAQSTSSQPVAPPPQANSQQSTPAAQPATPPPSAAQADQTAQQADQLQPLTYKKHEGFWGHLNPFARKKYVQRQLSPMRDRLNELDELTASNARLIKDVDARATQGIQMASLRANEADQHAIDAGNKAQLANQTAQQANTQLQSVSTAVQNIDQYKTDSQLELHFRPGQTVLSKKAKGALDQLATPLKDQKGYVVEIQGYSSGASAIQRSGAMADSVMRYLVMEDGIPVYRIYKVGMGNAPIADESGTTHRPHGSVVEISLLKNGVGDLAAPGSQANSPANQQLAPNSQSAPAPAPAQPQH
jgi:outer membrane protein OmpA-like peptidoglycan-associated protein